MQGKTFKETNMKLLEAMAISVCAACFAAGGVQAGERCAPPPTSGLIVNVMDKGARGDGVSNDTKAIQFAVDLVAGSGGTVFVPDGVFMVDAVTGIRLGSDMTLRLSSGAIIKAIPNAATSYNLIRLDKVSNVSVIGGTLLGERSAHSGSAGQWGMGINILGAEHVVVEGVTAKDAWGDGFYVGNLSRNIKFCSIAADNNRRQGMSVVSVDGLSVLDSSFTNTGGVGPQGGIDIEPNDKDTVNDVRIRHSRFVGNQGFGIYIYAPRSSPETRVSNVTIDSNEIADNKAGGIVFSNTSANTVKRNILRNNGAIGIKLDKYTSANMITDNVLDSGQQVLDHGQNSVTPNGQSLR